MFKRVLFRTMLIVVAAVALVSFLVAPTNTPGQRWGFGSRPDKTAMAPETAPETGVQGTTAPEQAAAPVMTGTGKRSAREPGSPSAQGGADGFYADYRVERESGRSAEMEMLQSLINNPNTTPLVKQDAQQKLLKLVSLSESELQLENLLKAEGYSDALVFLQGDSLTIILSGNAVNETTATRIGDLATRATGIPLPKIVIVEKK
ncbi:MAG: SpoIIIAH-like family protein [Firmicutes bacterium]|nr:SpoIIIAH-like family protein [Bacillota bacterium]